jgi:hypothetical protein
MEEQPYTDYNYQTAATQRLPIRQLLSAIIIVLALIVAFEVASALIIRNKTGLLEVSAPAGTNITISANNKAAINIGVSSAKFRIAPGSYLLMGEKNGARGTLIATVTKGQITSVNLSPTSSAGPRSSQSINFSGQNGLINAGLSVSQVNEIEQDIFEYKSSATTVTIDQSSIEPGPHNPNTDIGFKLDFSVSIDGTTYAAVANYVETQDTSLQLTNSSGQVVYNSNATTQQTGGD